MKTKKLTVLALSVALAMILSFIESQIPSFVPIPGVKIGLANIVVVFALYKLGWKEAAGISLLRVFLVSVLFGHAASFFYSIAGALLSFCGMALLKRTGLFSHIAVSVAGGVPDGLYFAGNKYHNLLSSGPDPVRNTCRYCDWSACFRNGKSYSA